MGHSDTMCHICGSASHSFSSAKIMNQYEIQYFRCLHCGFVQTEEPYWISKAYSHVIAEGDVGLIYRNNTLSEISKAIIYFFFNRSAKYLDYGGGYGIFTRIMRDAGYDFYHYDPYCVNLFSKEFDTDLSKTEKYELITAFEVMEHMIQPIHDIGKILQMSDSILVSTQLLPDHAPKPGEWAYYSLESGQHISLFTLKSLTIIAEKFGLNLYSNNRSLHLFSKKNIQSPLFHIIRKPEIAKLLNQYLDHPARIKDVF